MRLVKINFEWLKNIEKEEVEFRVVKEKLILKFSIEEDFFIVDMFDIFIEVRRFV